MDQLQSKLHEIHRHLVVAGKPVTISSIKALLTRKSENEVMFLKEFDKHNQRLIALKGKDYAQQTILRYKASYKHTKDFILWKYKKYDIDISKLNYEFISDFEFWLKTERKCAHKWKADKQLEPFIPLNTFDPAI